MHKLQAVSSLLALAGSFARAQEYNQSPPFALEISDSSGNATLNGRGVYSCHAGAAIEGLCVSSDKSGPKSAYFHNTTQTTPPPTSGQLVWNLPVNFGSSVQNVSEPMTLQYNPGSNVAVPMLYPSSSTYTAVGFDAANKMFIEGYFDDSTFSAGTDPRGSNPTTRALYHWHVCYTIVGGYYYQALAWVTTAAPHNPTCTPVNVTRTTL